MLCVKGVLHICEHETNIHVDFPIPYFVYQGTVWTKKTGTYFFCACWFWHFVSFSSMFSCWALLQSESQFHYAYSLTLFIVIASRRLCKCVCVVVVVFSRRHHQKTEAARRSNHIFISNFHFELNVRVLCHFELIIHFRVSFISVSLPPIRKILFKSLRQIVINQVRCWY